ncbi:FAD-dependent oxidoreductase [bacterium]|nr:FAD-dependent oxidoreductase [bacterium]
MSERKRIVILGGGFGGVYTAIHLEKLLGRRDDFEIHLINHENYFVFQPMLAEVISGSIGIMDAVTPMAKLLKRTKLHIRDVEEVDLKNKVVVTSPGFVPKPHRVPYDHLVLALGKVTHFKGMPGLPEHAIPFKNLGDALYIRNHAIHAIEEADIETDPQLRKELLTFVIAGGGFSGVEAAADLNDFLKDIALRHYEAVGPEDVHVILLHSQDRILPEVEEKLGLFAAKILEERGVQIRFKTRLAAATKTEAILSTGERIATRTLISTVPASPNPIIEKIELPKDRGHVKANLELQVEGSDHIWSLGDCAVVPHPSGKGFCPPTAQFGMRQAAVAAHNIVASIRGGTRKQFAFKGLGSMCSLGHQSGVADVMGFHISGILAWLMWRVIYLSKLPGFDRKVKVTIAWLLDFFFPPDLVQLKLFPMGAVVQEHYEVGQEIFHKGDLGDRIYIIVSGKAQVSVEDGAGSEKLIATLTPGEYFGEMALLNQTTRGATVRCVESMDVLALRKQEFGALAANLPDLKASFEKKMQQRLQGTASGK